MIKTADLGTHVMFFGEVTDAEVLDKAAPMTYSYYHQVKKGWRCSVCGYILESEIIPEDYVCPICGQGREKLEKFS